MKKIYYIILISVLLAFSPISFAGEEVVLKNIKVNNIGNKTRVTFIFNAGISYTLNYLENPFRILLDFQKSVQSYMDSVKVFNIGYVKNVRSYLIENQDKESQYILDACVVELDRECKVDVFQNGNIIQADFVDIQDVRQEQKVEFNFYLKRKRAEEFYQQGLAYRENGQWEKARDKFQESMEADETFYDPEEPVRDMEKKIRKRKKDLKKQALSFEKELNRRMKTEKELALDMEQEIIKKKKEVFSYHMDIRDLEEKGFTAYKKGNFKEAIAYWGRVLDAYPKNDKIARYIAEARKKGKASALKESEDSDRVVFEQEKDKDQYAVLGDLEIREFQNEISIIFPISRLIECRYGELIDPPRIIVYFKDKIFTAMGENTGIGRGNVKGLRLYLSDSERTSQDEKKIDALVLDLEYSSDFEIVHDKKNFAIIVFQEKKEE